MQTCIRLLSVVGLALATGTGWAAEVRFPSAKLGAADPDVTISGQLHRPAGDGPYPAIVLLHACGGLTQQITFDWPPFLVGLGYVVLAPDTLGSRGYYKGCAALKDRATQQARDAYGALDYLASQGYVDPRRIAAVGFSLGAITINSRLMMTTTPRAEGRPEFRAFASFYGFCRTMNAEAARKTPLLQIIAEKDELHAPSCIERSKVIAMEAHVLPGAYHGFDQTQFTQMRTDPFGSRMIYDAAAAEKAQELLRVFLATQLK